MPGVRTGFAHVVAPLTEGKVTEFLLENGAHPFHFCPSPPVSLLFLSLTRPEKTEVLGQKFPFGELKCHNGRWKCPSWTFFGGRILSRRDAPWGTSRIPHDVSCSERTNAYVEAIRIQKRPASWKFPKDDSIGTGRNGYACFPHRRSAYAVQSREAQRTSSTLCPFTTYTPSGSATRTLPLLL